MWTFEYVAGPGDTTNTVLCTNLYCYITYTKYGTWHGKLNFSADDHTDNPHIAIRVCPRGQSADSVRTLRGFRVEFCECKTKITQSIDIRTILAMCFLIHQPVVVYKVCLWFPPFSTRIRTEDPHPPARKIRVCLRGNCVHPSGSSTAPLRKIRVVPHNYPRVSARNNHGIPRKKLSFPCHVP